MSADTRTPLWRTPEDLRRLIADLSAPARLELFLKALRARRAREVEPTAALSKTQ